MEIWLARHGATEWSRHGRHTGVTDLPLLLEGEEEARAMGRRLRGHPFGVVLSSPMTRARETARLAGFPDPEASDLLREVDYGRYEGLTTTQILAERSGWELFDDGSPEGETPSQIAARADRLLGEIGEPNADVLLFAHGHILRALATRYLGLEISVAGLLRLDAGSLSILGHEHGHHALKLWNEILLPSSP